MSADPTKVLSQDGTPIAVWRSGGGPPLVLIHGAAADHNRWAPVLPALEKRFAVFAVDRRGRGRSGDTTDYVLEREFEDVVAVVESAGEDVNVLGHSYGGICALEAALLTGKIRKLVLYEPPMGFLKSPPHVVDRLQTLLEEGRRDELLAYFMQEVAGLPSDQVELLRSLPAWAARLDAADTIPREERASREYVFDASRFGALEVPTLYLQGGDSSAPFKAAGEALRGGAAGLPRRDHARAATRRDGHRHQPVHRRGAELPAGAGAGGLRSVTPAEPRRRADATTLGALRRGSGSTTVSPSEQALLPTCSGADHRPLRAARPGGRRHAGVDFAAPSGTLVQAVGAGTTVVAGYNSGGYGNLVVIQHRLGYTTWYAHLSGITSRVGESVSGGTRIGYVGSTGFSTGPHLHFEARKWNVPFDPLPYMLAGAAARAARPLRCHQPARYSTARIDDCRPD